ncbi:DUF397 domain-containing protein [Streptomyces sp. NPDC002845]
MLKWQKSTYCPEGNSCLNVATAPDGTILLRESDTPEEILSTSPRQLHALISTMRARHDNHPHP